MLRLRNAKALLVPDSHVHEVAHHGSRQSRRELQLLVHEARPLVDGYAHDVLRHDPGAASRRQEGALGLLAYVHRNIHCRIAYTDDQNVLVTERLRRAVVVRMDRLAAELTREVRVTRIPEMAVGNNHGSEQTRLAGIQRDSPYAVGFAIDVLALRVELDVGPQLEALHVGLEI